MRRSHFEDYIMKTTVMVVAVIGLLAPGTGCKPSNRVTFKPALVSIDPGAGWRSMDVPAQPPACSPRLMSPMGMINAVVLDADDIDLKKAADKFQTSFASTGKAIPDSFKQEDFTTESGLRGIHLSYTGQSAKSTTPDMRSHSFITQARPGRYVSISYITSPDVESGAVLEAIRKTLRVE